MSISVIIATHNRSSLLPRAVESARHAAADVEVIVVDDASSDDTPVMCARLPVSYVRLERNGGVCAARNAGIAHSSGEFINFLDDDDALLPGGLERLKQLLKERPAAAFAYGQSTFSDQEGRPLPRILPSECPAGDLFWHFLQRNFVSICAVLLRRSCLESAEAFDSQFAPIEDWDLWIRLSQQYHAAALWQPVADVRQPTETSGQHSSNKARMFRQAALLRTRNRILPRVRTASFAARWVVRQQLRDQLSSEAYHAVLSGDVRRAKASLVSCMRVMPTAVMTRGFWATCVKLLGMTVSEY